MSSPIQFSTQLIAALDNKLNQHPLYEAVRSLDDLRIFMGHHVFSVWDFMSLLKYLQHELAPAAFPWNPRGSASARFFINQIVLAEESDDGMPDAKGGPTYVSHFELYCDSMREVGADPADAIRFTDFACERGIDGALAQAIAPPAARAFLQTTFGFIATDQPHVVGAAFALGREHIIPAMFRSLLAGMKITEREAPAFHHYLKRHIDLDQDLHAPLALQMMNELIGGDAAKLREAENAAYSAVAARVALWDGVLAAIEGARRSGAAKATPPKDKSLTA